MGVPDAVYRLHDLVSRWVNDLNRALWASVHIEDPDSARAAVKGIANRKIQKQLSPRKRRRITIVLLTFYNRFAPLSLPLGRNYC